MAWWRRKQYWLVVRMKRDGMLEWAVSGLNSMEKAVAGAFQLNDAQEKRETSSNIISRMFQPEGTPARWVAMELDIFNEYNAQMRQLIGERGRTGGAVPLSTPETLSDFTKSATGGTKLHAPMMQDLPPHTQRRRFEQPRVEDFAEGLKVTDDGDTRIVSGSIKTTFEHTCGGERSLDCMACRQIEAQMDTILNVVMADPNADITGVTAHMGPGHGDPIDDPEATPAADMPTEQSIELEPELDAGKATRRTRPKRQYGGK